VTVLVFRSIVVMQMDLHERARVPTY
jgi:hypothetical protein